MMIVVLDDGSTYSGDGSVVFLTDAGKEIVEENLDAKFLEDEHIEKEISINDLVDAYIKVHGQWW